ncbi:hypothetical protein SAMN05421641_1525, partial [Paracoccus thiocyanatus]
MTPAVPVPIEYQLIGPTEGGGVGDLLIGLDQKRQHEPQQIVGDLLNAEISEKQARSIKYQMT